MIWNSIPGAIHSRVSDWAGHKNLIAIPPGQFEWKKNNYTDYCRPHTFNLKALSLSFWRGTLIWRHVPVDQGIRNVFSPTLKAMSGWCKAICLKASCLLETNWVIFWRHCACDNLVSVFFDNRCDLSSHKNMLTQLLSGNCWPKIWRRENRSNESWKIFER